MRIATPITLTDAQRAQLLKYAHSRTASVRLAERCAIVLLAADGLQNKLIADMLGLDRILVGRWRDRYAQLGLEGIESDLARGGRPVRVNTSDLIEMRCQHKPANATQWSTRTMAAQAGISKSSVSRHWRANGLKPHLIRTFKVSHDKDFEAKLEAIVGLYMSPPEHALVLCLDEKSQIQALDRTQPGLPLKRGRAKTMTHDYKRNGTTTLFAAMNTLDGKVISCCAPRHRHQEWLKFLKLVDQETPQDKQLHLICDNYATHKHPVVQRWLEKHPRIHIQFTPTSASWLNMVERFFRSLNVDALRHGVFTSVQELQEAIGKYIQIHNENPKPYIWTAKANDILQKVMRANSRLSSKNNGTLQYRG